MVRTYIYIAPRCAMRSANGLLPSEVQASLPWPRSSLRSIELPAGASVPTGALQKCSSRHTLLQRSVCETPLVEQVAILSQITAVISTQLDAPDEGAAYLCMCFELGWLLEHHQRWSSGSHPANLACCSCDGWHPCSVSTRCAADGCGSGVLQVEADGASSTAVTLRRDGLRS